MNHRWCTLRTWALGLLMLALAGVAAADGRFMTVPLLPLYKQECAACHMAYPPGLLPAASWRRLMSGLEKHFGTDAALEPAQVQQVSAWLQANAGTHKRVREAPLEDRITRSAWFVREHREVEPAVWRRASVKSAAQCTACHAQAEQGRFDEHEVRIPR